MLSAPDFIEKQIVVILGSQYKNLSLRNDNILLKEGENIVNQISCSKVFCLFIIGECTITSRLIDKLTEYQVSIYMLRDNCKPRCIIGSSLEGNYVLRSKQYFATPAQELQTAKHIIQNKIANQGRLLKELRDKDADCKKAITTLQEIYKKVDTITSDDSLRGLEGTVSKIFFAIYFQELKWYKRMPRTRNDTINLLMDIGYTYIYNFVEANLNLYGFDIYKGVYHKLFFERKSLVCDLVEPFRCLIDRQIRKAYNLGQIKEKDFRFSQQEYSLDRDKRGNYTKIFLEVIMEHKMKIFEYVKAYYRSIMAEDLNTLPIFYIDEKS